MSRRGNCYANAHAESCWSRLKIGLLDGGSFRNLTKARLEISHYLAYYNAERRHSALGYFAPNHFETQFQTTSQLCAAQLDHLNLPAVSSLQHNPQQIAFYARLRSRHPSGKLGVIAVMRKLLLLGFPLWKKYQSYDPHDYPAHRPKEIASA